MSIKPSIAFQVFLNDSFTCVYCGQHPPNVALEVDHIIPRAEGGTDDRSNLATACFRCNRGKGSIIPEGPIPDHIRERGIVNCIVCDQWVALGEGQDPSISYRHEDCELV